MATTMNAREAISAKMAKCYVWLDMDGDGEAERYNFMSAINIEVNFEKTKTEVPILGRMNAGHKATGSSITGSAEFHYNTSVWVKIAEQFQNNGTDLYFDMEIINDDPTAIEANKQGITLYDCNFDNITLAAFDADGDYLTQSMDFTAERFAISDHYNTVLYEI